MKNIEEIRKEKKSTINFGKDSNGRLHILCNQ